MAAMRFPVWLGIVGVVLIGNVTSAFPAFAVSDPPEYPPVDCSKKWNQERPECKPARGASSNDELYNAAYWLGRGGDYAAALELLRQADQSDPRILNYTGFVTRKLGDVDGAMVFYARALALKPDYTMARAYLGEAFLQKGDVASAEAQLGEIEMRCGRACAEYADLAGHIARYKAVATPG